MSIDTSAGRQGAQDVDSDTSQYNATLFMVMQILSTRNHCALVQVREVTRHGEVEQVGYVDVQPMVNQLDGQGVAVPHGIINNLPYFRLQGGANAVIMDPEPGDIGIAVFADRDISSVKATGDIANPGSMRRADMADGLYIGGFLNAAPTQYVQFTADGIKIVSPTAIVLEAPNIELNAETVAITASESMTVTTAELSIDASDSATINTGQFTVNGPAQFNGTIDASGQITAPTVEGTADVTGGGVSLKTHKHLAVKAGTDQSGPPAP